MAEPEMWLRGAVDGYSAQMQPVVHALLQAVEDVEEALGGMTREALWARPGGAASAGFHGIHAAGSLDRLLTYARGEPLSDAQRDALAAEKALADDVDAAEVVARFRAAVHRALDQLRATPDAALDEPRAVGRGRLPSTVRGLVYHAGEHTSRHAGQAITTAKIVRAGR